MQKITWREKFAAILVLLIGILYLLWQVIDLSSTKSSAYMVKDDAILINKGELFIHIRSLLTILLGFAGGIFLWKGRTAGWMLSVPLLILFLVFAAGGLVELTKMRTFDAIFIFLTVCVALLLLAVVFLFLPSARSTYRVGRITYLTTLVFLLILAAVYFFLQ